MAASILEHLNKKFLMSSSDENIKNQDINSSYTYSNEHILHASNQFKVQNIVSCKIRDRKPTKEIESKAAPSLEKLRKLPGNNVCDELNKTSLKEKFPGLSHEIKLCNSYAQKTRYGSLIQE